MVFYGQTIDGVPDRGYVLFITALVMVLTAAIFVTIRLATRIHLREFGWDDLFLVIALAASAMTTAAINLAVVHGYGRHKADMGGSINVALKVCSDIGIPNARSKLSQSDKWFFVAQIPYKIALGFTKASLVLLYLRIFITKYFQRVGKGFLVVIAAWTVVKIKPKQCVDKDRWWYAFAAINTLTDVLIAILPIPPVCRLKLSKRDRIGLFCVFSVGALSLMCDNDE
ncbi:uncharacterized protein N7479_003753 [Penicillium vulpinum]|uniref:uncharacterized protein n=1 Tax=Penicillium vulpinum TaxID=29845 RepID=UPI0025484BBD|nr:uncharacterized protein N7479_003753 [Penicillium vulpinum]KAJ5963877.1 hypothetical protein N7479_003753 [Penicillium vulpinum]